MVGRSFKLFGYVLVPLALLSTNITLGLPVPETVPLLFVATGIAYLVSTNAWRHSRAAMIAVVIATYGSAGVLGYAPFDGVRVLTGAAVFLIALQLCAHRALVSRACEVSIYILMALV